MSATDGLVFAFDIGTSSLRTALFDTRATRISASTAQRGYTLWTGVRGAAELDPITLLQAARECLRETLGHRDQDRGLAAQPILAVGASCFWHSFLGVDADGTPLTPIYTWADARCAQDAEDLRNALSERAIHRRTGCMLRPSYWPAQLIWLWRTQPGLFQSVHYWLSPAEWLYWQLAGVRACATGMATATGLYDPGKMGWDEPMLRVCQVGRERLLTLDDSAQSMAMQTRPLLPELADAAWFAGIGDGAASNLGSGATRAGLAAINFGTSAAIRIMREGTEAQAPFGLFAYRIDRHRYLVGGPVSNAGNLYAWCLRELRLPDDPAAIETALIGRARPEHGLTVLPFWTAERAPSWREDMSGCILGLRESTTALDILQAVGEAIFHRLAQIAEQIPDSDQGLEVIVSGGLNRSPSGLQRLANVLGRTISVCGEAEASLRGAAVDALERLGYSVPPPPLERPVVAQPEIVERYAAERQRQQTLEELLYPPDRAPAVAP